MRSFSRANGILLALFLAAAGGPARADGTTATCDAAATPAPDFSWLDDLSRALASGGPPSPVSATAPARTSEPPVVKRLPEPDSTPSSAAAPSFAPRAAPAGAFDLRDPLLSKLQRSARASASKCRSNPRTGRTLCGIHVSKYLCYRGVKEALAAAGLVAGTWSEEAASDAHDAGTLAKKGFTNVLDRGFDSEHAPLGAVLVYSGGAKNCGAGVKSHGRPCGHIEIKTKENEYCSDYCKAIPADQYLARTLVGIYVKE
jgi:hypothetical protein